MSPCTTIDPLKDSYRRKLLQVTGAVVLTSLFFFCDMSEPVHENAVWNQQEIDYVMDYLRDHASEAGDGGNFKDSVYQAAATYIAPYYKSGPVKSAKHVKNKYKTVSTSLTIRRLLITNRYRSKVCTNLSLTIVTRPLDFIGTTPLEPM